VAGFCLAGLGQVFVFAMLPAMMPSVPEPLLATYKDSLARLAEQGQRRRCRSVEPEPESSINVVVNGKKAVNFSSNDYLGLVCDPRLQDAAIEAIRRYGTGSSASRLISGTNELVVSLERAVARFKQTEAALVFNSGYQANVSILQAVLQPGDWVFCDKLNHASLMDGCMLSGARWTRYKHLDLKNLEARLQKAPADARKWIVTDSVFSMDGDYPDLAALVDLAEHYNALVMVDEAHATGIYGEQRHSGLCEQFGVGSRVALQMGTFSKALGGAGAYVAGSKVMVDTLVNFARGFIYSTALPPATIGAAAEAIRLVQTDGSMRARLWQNMALFTQCIQQGGLSERVVLPLPSPIIPVLIGDSAQAVRVSQALLEQGFLVQGIRPPTVPPGTARLRIALSASHTPEQIEGLVMALAGVMRKMPMAGGLLA
jgi:8-amino-7-oxononanoate synthase